MAMLQMRVFARNFFTAGLGRQQDVTVRQVARGVEPADAALDDVLDLEDDFIPDYCKYGRLGSGLRPGLGGDANRFTL
jgi:hypothetical protein